MSGNTVVNVGGGGSALLAQISTALSAVTLVHFDPSANVYGEMVLLRLPDWILCLAALPFESRLHLLHASVRASHVLSISWMLDWSRPGVGKISSIERIANLFVVELAITLIVQ